MIPYIDIHTHHISTSPDEFAVYNCVPETQISFVHSCGLHPWQLSDIINQDLSVGEVMERVRMQCRSDLVVAVGETGLDAVRGGAMKLQKEVFRQHVLLSEELEKPLIIHCVKSVDEIIEIQRKMKPRQQWIFHGYRKKQVLAQQLMTHGFDLSFGLQFDKQALIQAYQAGKMWLETDDSKVMIKEHYSHVADILGVSVEALKYQLYHRAVGLSSSFRQQLPVEELSGPVE